MNRHIILASLFILFATLFNNATAGYNTANKSTFNRPNFAFPQTVIADAESQLKEAIANKNGEKTVMALIQTSLAKSIITTDTLPSIIESIDKVIAVETNPCIKSILYLLEAKIYSAYFNHFRYKISSRNNLAKELNNDFSEWDAEQFKMKISSLLELSLHDSEVLKSTHINRYPRIIIYHANSLSTYPTMFDFIAYECINIYEKTDSSSGWNPFARTSENKNFANKATSIYDELISFHKVGTRPYIKAILNKLNFTETATKERLDSLYDLYKISQNVAPIILEITARYPNALKENYSLLKSYIKHYPESDYTASIQNRLYSMENMEASVSFKHQYTTADSIGLTCFLNNVNDFTISIYKVSKPDKDRRYTTDEVKNFKNVDTKNFSAKSAVPFCDTIHVTMPPLELGQYAVLISFDKKTGGYASTHTYCNTFTVSDITPFRTQDNIKKSRKIFAVNAISGTPYKNVNVTSTDYNSQKFKGATNDKGYVIADNFNYTNFEFAKGKDKGITANFGRNYNNPNQNKFITKAHVFTDLAIYRPGETIHLAAICYRTTTDKKEVMRNREIKIVFCDAMRDTITTKTLKTDNYGRAACDLTVPANRMNGTYRIEIVDIKDNTTICRDMVNVSEYKTPNFYIEFIDPKKSYDENGIINIKGVAKTFSGMPVADIPIKYTLSSATWFYNFNEIASSTTQTDSIGFFEITMNASMLKEREKSGFYTYQIIVTGTDQTGDTQSESSIFTLGESLIMKWDFNGNSSSSSFVLDASQEVKLPISVISNQEEKPRDYKCILSLTDKNGITTTSLSFNSNNPIVDLSHVNSGEYKLSAWIENDTTIRINDKDIIIYRPTDKESPITSALWIPEINLSCVPGAEGNIFMANSFDISHVYYVISQDNGIIKEDWMTLNKGVTHFKYHMPNDAKSGIIIQFYCVKNLRPYEYSIEVKPKIEETNITFTIESFRDKITAGSSEKWTLHLEENGKPLNNGAIISAMTDKAINTLVDNTWKFSPKFSFVYNSPALNTYNQYTWGFMRNTDSWTHNEVPSNNIYPPLLRLYNMDFFSSNLRYMSRGNYMITRSITNTTSMVSDLGMPMASFADSETAEHEVVTDEPAYGKMAKKESATIEKELSNIDIRTSAVKTAFWKPMLSTDKNGNTVIEFNTPNVNTTWMLQAIGYDDNLNAASILKDVVSSKPIMVKTNAPRFLRQGDKTTLLTSVQNATNDTQSCVTVIEILNPINNEIYNSRQIANSLEANQSEAVSIDYLVPDTVSLVALRIKTTNGKYSDGEQVLIPILQSISPVIESKPFYIDHADTDYKISLPKFPADARITFEYCNNPVWYVATALPSIKSEGNTTATQIAHSIFANLTAQQIIKENSQIKNAINYWNEHQEDSALVSMLAKNQDLKIGTLLASPWLNESEQQTLRMNQLVDLFNEENTKASTDKLIKALEELQLSDGGFTWFRYKGAVSSPYTTLNVLQLIGYAKSLGGMNDNLTSIVKKAIKYIDKSIIKRYNNQEDKLSFTSYGNYAYTRSLFLDVPMSATVENLYGEIIQSLSTEWQTMDILNKAYTSITLANFGQTEKASTILNSILQFAIKKDDTGMYWDNFSSGWNIYCDKITLTSLILQAMQKAMPQSSDINQIRKWLLLEKQTNDWGNSSLAANAVHALLTTGTKWLNTSGQPSFQLNGVPFHLNSTDSILGYGKMSLSINNSSTNNNITITRNGNNPSWGAVYCQYNAPMTSIKAASVSQISINKDILSYEASRKNLKVGDKVQVRLVIKNSRDLEYVTVTDERASCLEPSDKNSGFRYADGTGYYMEIKDSKTNLFFYSLPKGTHVITYEAYITNSGKYNSGIATAQCQYAAQITAHSAGGKIKVAE